jgi:hypothetical protein
MNAQPDLTWVTAHYAALQAQYGGEWIAVCDAVVLAHGPDLDAVGEQARVGGRGMR